MLTSYDLQRGLTCHNYGYQPCDLFQAGLLPCTGLFQGGKAKPYPMIEDTEPNVCGHMMDMAIQKYRCWEIAIEPYMCIFMKCVLVQEPV